jgi:hypothetical protein
VRDEERAAVRLRSSGQGRQGHWVLQVREQRVLQQFPSVYFEPQLPAWLVLRVQLLPERAWGVVLASLWPGRSFLCFQGYGCNGRRLKPLTQFHCLSRGGPTRAPLFLGDSHSAAAVVLLDHEKALSDARRARRRGRRRRRSRRCLCTRVVAAAHARLEEAGARELICADGRRHVSALRPGQADEAVESHYSRRLTQARRLTS